MIDFLSQTFVSSGCFRIVQFGVRLVVQSPRMRGFPFFTRRDCAESNARRNRPSPLRSSIPIRERWFRPRNRARSRRANRPAVYKGWLPSGSVSDPDHGSGRHPRPIGDRRSGPTSPGCGISWHGLRTSRLNRREFGGLESAACGSRPRRAYRPYRSCGRVAEGGGLLNRYRVVKPYRGFESLRLRQFYTTTR